MHLMVYAPYGRTGIYMLQEFCRRVGIAATDDGDSGSRRRARRAAAGPSTGDTCCARRRTSGSEAALADALLHPQDRAYSVPQLFEILHGAGLRFGRWVTQAPYSPRCGVMARLPQVARLRAAPRRAVRRRRAVPRHHGSPQRRRLPGRRRGGHRRHSRLRRRCLARLCADPPARHDLRARSVCRRGGGGAHQPHPHLHRHLPADRHAGETSVRRDRRDAHDPRNRADARGARCFRALFERLYWYDQVAFETSARPPRSRRIEADGEEDVQGPTVSEALLGVANPGGRCDCADVRSDGVGAVFDVRDGQRRVMPGPCTESIRRSSACPGRCPPTICRCTSRRARTHPVWRWSSRTACPPAVG